LVIDMKDAHKHSRNREAIRRLLADTKEHPCAEWIYAKLKPEFPDLSLGTVYRNLSVFRSEGDVICIGTVAGQERFDADTRPHAHFICECCGRVEDVAAPALDEEKYSAGALRIDGEIRGHSLTFYGLCRECCEQRG
jgi:Fur family peroxide stress response transcriptional regulator